MRRWLPLILLGGCLLALVACQPPDRVRPTPPAPSPPVYVDCPDCAGKGWVCKDGVCNRCKRCSGTGKVKLTPAPAPNPDDDVEGKRRRRRQPR